ncbi:DUF4344 domain-containing metallopeptidase [Gellertiella hungarica]|uniref:Metallopeptidase DUF4344 n=1 Tax=Gellertiella hungarica TaxID=1572859 RepID=A0A7W6NKY3_9HYPH|nr:DUF4344 domain-containing metallopeptidase [Gellertiella hungarica]MBB4065019.1 hypothetical protein [Gellertiella hungarica]
MRRYIGGLLLAAAALLQPASAADNHVPKEIAGLDEEGVTSSVTFMTGNVIYVLFHESGHMLISELNLPVLGREEDAVDTLSTVLLLEAKDEALDQALRDSVESWYNLGDAYEVSEEDFMDTHGLSKQRAYNIACMMIGQDQKRFKDMADNLEIPQERRDECEGEYQKARESWFTVLNPYMADDNDKVKFKLAYYKTKNNDLDFYRSILKEFGALEMLRDTFSGLVKLKDGIKLTANVCGEANAYWDPEARELTYCYEDAQSYAQMYAENYGPESSDESADSSSEGQ